MQALGFDPVADERLEQPAGATADVQDIALSGKLARAQVEQRRQQLFADRSVARVVSRPLALPVGVFGLLMLIQPTYFSGFLSSLWGILALFVAVVLMVVGSLWMMVVVKVKF